MMGDKSRANYVRALWALWANPSKSNSVGKKKARQLHEAAAGLVGSIASWS